MKKIAYRSETYLFIFPEKNEKKQLIWAFHSKVIEVSFCAGFNSILGKLTKMVMAPDRIVDF